MQVRIWPASRPPPVASKAMVAPVSTSAWVRSSMNVGAEASHTCFAPIPLSSAACSGLRTMLTRPMPSLRQMRLSIWPRLEAAAVCTSALWPSRRIVSTMPSAVSGFTKQDAPSAGRVPSGSTRHWSALMVRYCAYIAPPSTATVLPSRACAGADAPAATTTPAPSLPTGRDCPTRAAMLFMSRSGMRAVTTGLAGVPATLAVPMSAAPKSSPMSDGLIGVASMRTTTSSGAGAGVSTLISDSSSSPSGLTRDRS